MSDTQEKRVLLRLPLDLYLRLQALARADMRSIHAETIFLLREAINARSVPAERQFEEHMI